MSVSFIGAVFALVLHFVFGKTKWQRTPLVAIDGISPFLFSALAIVLLTALVVYNFMNWKCPKCHCFMGWKVRANRFQYSFDLNECPNCQTPLKGE